MKNVLVLGLLAAALSFGHVAAETEPGKATESPPRNWSETAVADLLEIQALIRDNHPGPVDPQNPGYRTWLESGLEPSMAMARAAKNQADYLRAIRLYLNGFRDGHMGSSPRGAVAFQWPGFLTSTPRDGDTRVTVADPDAPVPVGAQLVACDGVAADILLDQRVHRFRTNADLPQARPLNAPRLFYTPDSDQDLMKRCRFVVNGVEKDVALSWRPVTTARLEEALDAATATGAAELGVRERDGVWFVSIPTFDAEGTKMQALLDQITAQADALHRAPIVVIDVRGNGGGNSGWGSKAAAALWDERMVTALEESFDWTTDWRVSPLNIDLTRKMSQRATNSRLVADDDSRLEIVKDLERARAGGDVLLRRNNPPTSPGLPTDARSPFAGKVFFLTDSRCASACLDFADVVTRLPGVVHIGLPTSADAIYIDVVGQPLTSGVAGFSWSLKVYRNRIRGNNQWYEPKVLWTGGAMTDEAVAAWVKTL